MQYELKCLYKERKWREAIEFVLRMKLGPKSTKIEDLVAIGGGIIQNVPEGKQRDIFLVLIIEAFLRLDDIAQLKVYLLALDSDQEREKYADIIKESLLIRQW
ncbi:MAG: hypothetical protein A3C06_02670 [Candidatus Taylorbacteria bacterium RIFCSPHIGHO2_02_FULL_46_13]|uniref:Uncharacterized protein n=1 Tax=Candidatus Taylorbacteria bacterium RIFCSPHIGHO2_02_FULL_46_13 TaxID=1802312 RepID=A0A1G2MRD6_9BACT|nr:MAG: hypothetical protein A3C06_02670 [Candidatus Taylorbacteria bacterium RIFCSPHIGHO2_02_FULL_46_13]